jgi:hypothetical protein
MDTSEIVAGETPAFGMPGAEDGLSPVVTELMRLILSPHFRGHLEVGTVGGASYSLQLGFQALELVAARFGSYEAMGERITAAAKEGDAARTFMAIVDAADTILRAATQRHHPDITEDELDDLFGILGDASSVTMLANLILGWWKDHDTIGSYVAGIDPVVTLDERSFTLKFGLRAVRHVQGLIESGDFGSLQPAHYREVLRAMLLRYHGAEFHPSTPQNEALLDDLGVAIGLGGLRRLMAGAEQPTREKDEAGDADPNAPAGPLSPASGTGQHS